VRDIGGDGGEGVWAHRRGSQADGGGRYREDEGALGVGLVVQSTADPSHHRNRHQPVAIQRHSSYNILMDIKQFSDESFAGYLAGLLDGEGSIEIHPKECGVRVRIANTFKAVLDDIQSRLGYGRVQAYPKRPTLPLFVLCTSNAHDSRALLTFCRPYMQIKATRADKALAVITAMQGRSDAVEARNRAILAAIDAGETQTSIAERFGVTQPFVSYVKSRKTHGIGTRLNPRRSLKKGSPPSAELFTKHGQPLSDPCRPPSESAPQSNA
jgi:hypothetical protein